MDRRSLVPRVSVLMPVFNTARYLPQALRSLGAQSFRDFEVVIVDDGSSDASLALLAAYAAAEPRARVIARPNRGLIACRNELLSNARGELVAWMDSDDVSLPERLALQVAAFDADPALSGLGGVAQCIDPDGHALNVERYPLAHRAIRAAQREGGGMRFPTTMMRRAEALAVGGFREPFRIGEDLDFVLRLGERGKLANLPDTLYLYRQHLHSVCVALGPRWSVFRDEILALAREREAGCSDRLQRGERLEIDAPSAAPDARLEAHTYIRWSQAALDNGNRPLALRYAIAALRACPSTRAPWKALARSLLRPGAGHSGVAVAESPGAAR
jgi:glycosyltransferase involved in cell wall biosynthesis